MHRRVKALVVLAVMFAGPAAAADTAGARRAATPAPACDAGRIPVCVSRWNWDCIEGNELVVNHCDIYSLGCMTETE